MGTAPGGVDFAGRTTVRRESSGEPMNQIPKLLAGLNRGHYPVGVADVPWKYVVRSDKGLGRSAEKHYDTMTLDDIERLPVADYMA